MRRRPESQTLAEARWHRYAGDERSEDLAAVVLAWGTDFAQAVGELVDSGAVSGSLEIVQEIRDLDSAQEKGIFLEPELLAWLALAKVSLDIDQYVFHECAECR